MKKKLNENSPTEIGGKQDINIAVPARPYVEILSHVANDFGKDSNLYHGLKEIYLHDESFSLEKLINLLYEYGVYHKYSHLLNMNETTIEAPAKDIKTLKSTNAIGATDTVKVVPDNQKQPSSSSVSTTTPIAEDKVDAVIEPQDKETIKYLSNIKDDKTGEISKPFTISGKNYQMVRGVKPSKEVVVAVYCHDDLDEGGNNIIHPMEYFEQNIANKALVEATKNNPWAICTASVGREDKTKYEACVKDVKKQKRVSEELSEDKYNADDYTAGERDFHDKENLAVEKPVTPSVTPSKPKENEGFNSLKLAEFKHFFIDKKTGKLRKFKKNEELAKAVMAQNECYMNLSELKKYMDETLFGSKKSKVVEADDTATTAMPQKPDVKLAIDQMIQRMKPYMDKLNEPLEKLQFIAKLTTMLQLPSAYYPKLLALLKQGTQQTFANPNAEVSDTTSTTTVSTGPTTESRVITKTELMENIEAKTIKTIKVKDI